MEGVYFEDRRPEGGMKLAYFTPDVLEILREKTYPLAVCGVLAYVRQRYSAVISPETHKQLNLDFGLVCKHAHDMQRGHAHVYTVLNIAVSKFHFLTYMDVKALIEDLNKIYFENIYLDSLRINLSCVQPRSVWAKILFVVNGIQRDGYQENITEEENV